jgi:hypothetical protein
MMFGNTRVLQKLGESREILFFPMAEKKCADIVKYTMGEESSHNKWASAPTYKAVHINPREQLCMEESCVGILGKREHGGQAESGGEA